MSQVKALPLLSKEEYLEIISTIKNPQTKDEKYKIYLAVNFVRNNIDSLDKAELKTLIRNDSLIKSIGKDYEQQLNSRYTQLNLQEIDKQKCIEIFSISSKPISNDDKFQFHLALTYFKENVLSFDAKELKDILANEYVNLHIGKKFDREVIEKCIKNKKSFPIVLSNWGKEAIVESKLQAYLDIIHDENNEEQLNFFCKKRVDQVGDYITQKGTISPLLQDLYVKVNPQYLLQVNWPEEEACAWLDKYNAVTSTLFPMLYLYENKLGTKLKEKIYESAKEQLFNSSYGFSYKINLITNENTNFLKYLKKHYCNELRAFLKTEITDQNEEDTRLNIAQSLICSHINFDLRKSHQELYNIICDNRDLLLEPIKSEFRFYEKKISIFEYALKNTSFTAFAPFTLNGNNVDADKRKLILAAAFCLLQNKHGVFEHDSDDDYRNYIITNSEYLENWYPQIISQATNEELSKYIEKAIKGHESNTEFVKEMNALKLKIELSRDLPENNAQTDRKLKL